MKFTKSYSASFLLGTALVGILWVIRIYLTQSWFYSFLLWNLFLTFIPYCITHYLKARPALGKVKWGLCFAAWLLFFPNAPYIVTDLTHLHSRNDLPIWYDAAMIFTASLTGLWIGCISLMQMEDQWRKRLPSIKAHYFIAAVLLLCGFGIYLGRVLRFNSWDVLVDPLVLAKVIAKRVLFPWEYIKTWSVTLLFAALMWVAYRQVKNLAGA